jgi:hypothetical protein
MTTAKILDKFIIATNLPSYFGKQGRSQHQDAANQRNHFIQSTRHLLRSLCNP